MTIKIVSITIKNRSLSKISNKSAILSNRKTRKLREIVCGNEKKVAKSLEIVDYFLIFVAN